LVVVALIVLIAVFLMLHYTKFGRSLYVILPRKAEKPDTGWKIYFAAN